MDVLLRAALDPLCGSEAGGDFTREPPAKGKISIPVTLSEVCGLGTFDCEGFP